MTRISGTENGTTGESEKAEGEKEEGDQAIQVERKGQATRKRSEKAQCSRKTRDCVFHGSEEETDGSRTKSARSMG
jgi:hypothetical protein